MVQNRSDKMEYNKCESCGRYFFARYSFCPYEHKVRKYFRDIHLNWLDLNGNEKIIVYSWFFILSGLIFNSILLYLGFTGDKIIISFVITLVLSIIYGILIIPELFEYRMVTYVIDEKDYSLN